MDLYVLDSLLRRTEVIDRYESLIWTERFNVMGDFQFLIHSTIQNRTSLAEGSFLVINESEHIMVVETIEDKHSSDGKALLTVSGRSLEAILEDRISRNTLATLEASPRWVLTGTPGNIVRQLFDNICVHGMLDKKDIIPFITTGSIFPEDTIPEPQDVLTVELEPATLYETIVDLCVAYGLGFALVRDSDTSKLHFEVYAGSNRTALQRDLDAVIFSPELDSLTNVTELLSIESYKNVAYVFSPEATVVVYADEGNPAATGFDRRVLMVKVDSISPSDDEAGLTVIEILQKRGRDALAQHRRVVAFDGEIPTFGYKYNVHYRLGDIVEMRKSDGATRYMRVTEQIFVSDAEGVRSYPTLALDQYITLGSWDAVDPSLEWEDATDTWSES